MSADREPFPDQEGSPAVAYIAKCAEHGLHGERDDCFCGEPVAMIGYVRADLHLQVHSARGRHEAEVRRLRAEVVTLRGEVLARDGVICDRDTENDRLRKVLEQIAFPADFLQSRGALSSLARRELRGTSDETEQPALEDWQSGTYADVGNINFPPGQDDSGSSRETDLTKEADHG